MKFTAITVFTLRVLSSFFSPVTDCDEVFNYWEPLIFISRYDGVESNMVTTIPAFQTWEYANEYALRTFAFLTPFNIVLRTLSFFGFDLHTPSTFFFMRSLITAFTTFCELRLSDSLSERFGKATGKTFLLLSVLSPGMFHAGGAFLPSTLCMQVSPVLCLWERVYCFLGAWESETLLLIVAFFLHTGSSSCFPNLLGSPTIVGALYYWGWSAFLQLAGPLLVSCLFLSVLSVCAMLGRRQRHRLTVPRNQSSSEYTRYMAEREREIRTYCQRYCRKNAFAFSWVILLHTDTIPPCSSASYLMRYFVPSPSILSSWRSITTTTAVL